MNYLLRAKFALIIFLLTATITHAQVSNQDPLTTGLVTWLKLDEQAGTLARDASGYNRASQVVNGGNWHAYGKIGGCVRLNDGAALQIPLAWQPSAFSVSWWVYADAEMVKNFTQAVGASLNSSDAWQGFLFHASASGRIYTGTDLNTRLESGDNEFTTGVWQHFVFTFDRGKAALYKDGRRLAYRESGMTLPAAWSNLAFGSTINSALRAEAYYDDVRVYDRALAAAEVTQLAGKDPLTTGLVTWLKLDEQAGTLARDASGYNRASQVVNGGNWHAYGKIGGCVRLNDGAALQIPLAWQPSAFSVSWWVYADAEMVKNFTQAVGASLNSSDAWQGFLFHASVSGRIYVGTEYSTRLESGDNEFKTNVWQHFVFTFDRGEAALYKNGRRLAYRQSGMTLPAAWSNLAFGSTINSALRAEAYYDDVRVYDRPLSYAEVTQLAGDTFVPDPPVAARLRVARGYEAAGSYHELTNATPITSYQVDQDGVARTASFIHPDGTRFELQGARLRVRPGRAMHRVQLTAP